MTPAELATLAERLLEERGHLRTLLGDRYEVHVGPVREALQAAARARGRSVLAVAVEAAKGMSDDGKHPVVLLAAAADLLEEG